MILLGFAAILIGVCTGRVLLPAETDTPLVIHIQVPPLTLVLSQTENVTKASKRTAPAPDRSLKDDANDHRVRVDELCQAATP